MSVILKSNLRCPMSVSKCCYCIASQNRCSIAATSAQLAFAVGSKQPSSLPVITLARTRNETASVA